MKFHNAVILDFIIIQCNGVAACGTSNVVHIPSVIQMRAKATKVMADKPTELEHTLEPPFATLSSTQPEL